MKPEPVEIVPIRPKASRRLLDNEDMVLEFANLLLHGKTERLLQLFTEDAIITEPFSNCKSLRGREQIKYFLQIAGLLTKDLRCHIRTAQNRGSGNREISAFFVFSRGHSDKMRIRMTFGSENPDSPDYYRIKRLAIFAAD